MATASVVMHGTVNSDGGLNLDQKVALPPGPVQITIQPAIERNPKQTNWWQHLQEARAILEARGTGFRTQQEIEAEHEAFRIESRPSPAEGTRILIYCDSVILIYFFDYVGDLQERAANRLGAIQAANDQIAISDIVRMECRVMPIRQGDKTKLDLFDNFFTNPDVVKAALTTAVYDRATSIRAQHKFKTIDSVNLAAAVESGCDRFLTNDVGLRRFPDIAVEILP